ncbi:MAG: ketopantoate reductase family protein [Candidatus Thermoplasmatota archaeon]|nr:ketopantoate reductase family protein [Candidatus Thermoplasmatota archaeon]
MKILVYGAGALGSLFGGFLAAEHKMTLLCREEHADAISKHGLSIDGLVSLRPSLNAITELSALDVPPDMVLLTVKSRDVSAACADLKKNLEPVPVVGFQNGLGNRETMQKELWASENAHSAITSLGALFAEPGKVHYTGSGQTMIEKPVECGGVNLRGDGSGHLMLLLAESLQTRGLEVSMKEDMVFEIWKKASVNVGINYLSGLCGVENGFIASNWKRLLSLEKGLAHEVATVAALEGVNLSVDAILENVLRVATDTRTNQSSMLQDISRGKKTENDALAGEIMRRGAAGHVQTPRLEMLYNMVSFLEMGWADKQGNP